MANRSDSKGLDEENEEILESCRKLDYRSLFKLYTELLERSPANTTFPALALRSKARNGELPESTIPILIACLIDAPNDPAFLSLAKALAAFGRRAVEAAPHVIERLSRFRVTNDYELGIFDGAIHVLGYLGGEAERFLDDLEKEKPARVVRAGATYEGETAAAERLLVFEQTLARARELLRDPGDPRWDRKVTDSKGLRRPKSGNRTSLDVRARAQSPERRSRVGARRGRG